MRSTYEPFSETLNCSTCSGVQPWWPMESEGAVAFESGRRFGLGSSEAVIAENVFRLPFNFVF